MSPHFFYNGSARVMDVGSDGFLGNGNEDAMNGVRPVINLKANVTISSGTGTSTDPYIIS